MSKQQASNKAAFLASQSSGASGCDDKCRCNHMVHTLVMLPSQPPERGLLSCGKSISHIPYAKMLQVSNCCCVLVEAGSLFSGKWNWHIAGLLHQTQWFQAKLATDSCKESYTSGMIAWYRSTVGSLNTTILWGRIRAALRMCSMIACADSCQSIHILTKWRNRRNDPFQCYSSLFVKHQLKC